MQFQYPGLSTNLLQRFIKVLVSYFPRLLLKRLSLTFVFSADGNIVNSAVSRWAFVRENENVCVYRECVIFFSIFLRDLFKNLIKRQRNERHARAYRLRYNVVVNLFINKTV